MVKSKQTQVQVHSFYRQRYTKSDLRVSEMSNDLDQPALFHSLIRLFAALHLIVLKAKTPLMINRQPTPAAFIAINLLTSECFFLSLNIVVLVLRLTRWCQDKCTSSTGNILRKRRDITETLLKAA